MKSASSTASGSGQQGEKRSIRDDESRVQVEDTSETGTGDSTALPGAPSANTRRRNVVKSEPVAVTTQHGLVDHGSSAQVGKTIKPLWRTDTTRMDGRKLKNHSHLTVARHLREKTHTSMLVVTIREGEERGICSAALKELLRIVRSQIEERSVVIVSNRESAIWRSASVNTVLRENQLKYVDVEGMRVVTNNRCIAEQIKNDEVENVVMDGSQIGEFGKIGRELFEHRDHWSQNWKSWKVGKLQNWRGDAGSKYVRR